MVAQTGLTSKFTTLEYNGIQLRDCQTLKFEEIPVNDSSGMNLSHLKVTIRVLGYFHAQNTPAVWGTFPQVTSTPSASLPVQSSSVVYQYLHSYLLERRKRLRYMFTKQTGADPGMGFGGAPAFAADTVYDVSPAPVDLLAYGGANEEMETIYDVAGGPEPLGLSVSEITGNNIWRVEFEITFSVRPRCNVVAGNNVALDPDGNLSDLVGLEVKETDYDHSVHRALGVLSNRWSSVDSVDENLYLTRTIVGQVELSNPSWNPHDYRYLTLPPLHPGMRRERMNFTASNDNLKLMYEIVDQEITASAPGNATSFSLDHTESTDLWAPSVAFFSTRCVVKGSRDSSRSTLIRTAIEVIDSKTLLTALNVNGNFVVKITGFEISDHQGTDQNNNVSVMISGQRLLEVADNPVVAGKQAMSVLGYISARSVVASGITGTLLQHYNNQRSKGNRDIFLAGSKIGEEEPSPEGPIPALSALAAALQERCTENLGMGPAMVANLEDDAQDGRAARVDALVNDISGGNADDYATTSLWASGILVQIADNPTYNADLRWSSDHRTAIYSHYEVTSRYETDSLLFGMPAADTTSSFADTNPSYPNTVMVALGLPQTRRIVRITAQRFGAMPKLPSAPKVIEEKTPGTNTVEAVAVLESKRPIYMNPIPASDGSGMRIYSAGMEFTYVYTVEPPTHRLGIPEWSADAGLTDDTTTPNVSGLAPYRFPTDQIYTGNWGPTK
jgi:hypothetical protein